MKSEGPSESFLAGLFAAETMLSEVWKRAFRKTEQELGWPANLELGSPEWRRGQMHGFIMALSLLNREVKRVKRRVHPGAPIEWIWDYRRRMIGAMRCGGTLYVGNLRDDYAQDGKLYPSKRLKKRDIQKVLKMTGRPNNRRSQ